MEPGLFGIFQRMTGQPDIDTQIAQAMGRAPGQPGGPPASPLNPPPPGPAAGAAPAGGAPGPAAAPAAPPTPQAYTTQPDINSLYMQLGRQEQAAQMFNQGLATLVASSSHALDRNKYLSMGQVQPMDPGETFGNLMKLQQYQLGQQRFAATQAAVPGMLKQYGMTDPAQIAFYQNNPDQLQTLIAAHAPEGIYKNWLNARDDAVRNSGADPNDPQAVAKARSDFEQKNPLVNALTPAGGDPALNSLHLEANDWQSKHPGQPLPDWFSSTDALAAHRTQVANLSNTQTAASSTLPGLDYALTDMRAKTQAILDADQSGDLSAVLEKTNPSVLTAARAGGWGASMATQFGMTPAQFQLLHQIDDLTNNSNTVALKSANPHLLTSFSPIDSSLDLLKKFDVGAANYKTNATNLLNSIDVARAQAIGASGQLDRALSDPTIDQSKIDQSYLPGGKSFLGEPKQLTPDLVAWAKQQIAAGTPKEAIVRHFKLGGYLPRGEF